MRGGAWPPRPWRGRAGGSHWSSAGSRPSRRSRRRPWYRCSPPPPPWPGLLSSPPHRSRFASCETTFRNDSHAKRRSKAFCSRAGFGALLASGHRALSNLTTGSLVVTISRLKRSGARNVGEWGRGPGSVVRRWRDPQNSKWRRGPGCLYWRFVQCPARIARPLAGGSASGLVDPTAVAGSAPVTSCHRLVGPRFLHLVIYYAGGLVASRGARGWACIYAVGPACEPEGFGPTWRRWTVDWEIVVEWSSCTGPASRSYFTRIFVGFGFAMNN